MKWKWMTLVFAVYLSGCGFKNNFKDDGAPVAKSALGGVYVREVTWKGHRYLVSDGGIIHEESCSQQDDERVRMMANTREMMQRFPSPPKP